MASTPARVDARVPLALLQALQQQDVPPEPQPEENIVALFPHRLGLSGIIEVQVREFRRLARSRGFVAEERVRALLELIARRADAGAVFTAAGRELAACHFSGLSGTLRRVARRLPRPLRRRAALRTLRSARGVFLVAGELSFARDPLEIRATDALTARTRNHGGACRLYASLAAALLELSGLGEVTVAHPECQRRGDEHCVWRVENNGSASS